MANYVYGIVEAGASPPRAKGIGGARLSLVPGDGIAALVSEIPEGRLRLGREEVLVHSRVLEAALRRGTVLPMRFGVVMSGPEEVRGRLLEEHAAELREQLTELQGKVEIRIRATYDEDSLLREVLRDNPDIATIRATLRGQPDDATYYERIRLGELVATEVERRRVRDAEAIIDALEGAALAVDQGEPTHERVALQASFLVERARLTEFDKIVDEVAAGYGGQLRFKYVGPLTPHSFVQLAETV